MPGVRGAASDLAASGAGSLRQRRGAHRQNSHFSYRLFVPAFPSIVQGPLNVADLPSTAEDMSALCRMLSLEHTRGSLVGSSAGSKAGRAATVPETGSVAEAGVCAVGHGLLTWRDSSPHSLLLCSLGSQRLSRRWCCSQCCVCSKSFKLCRAACGPRWRGPGGCSCPCSVLCCMWLLGAGHAGQMVLVTLAQWVSFGGLPWHGFCRVCSGACLRCRALLGLLAQRVPWHLPWHGFC